MLEHVLVPLDQSELSHHAVPYAQALIGPRGKLTLVTVIRLPDTLYYEANPYTPPQREYTQNEYDAMLQEADDDARAYLRKVAAKHGLSDAGVAVYVGHPAESILEAAAELGVEAVVMTSHGRSGLGRWLFGSVTQKVLAACEVPVFVVPARVVTS